VATSGITNSDPQPHAGTADVRRDDVRGSALRARLSLTSPTLVKRSAARHEGGGRRSAKQRATKEVSVAEPPNQESVRIYIGRTVCPYGRPTIESCGCGHQCGTWHVGCHEVRGGPLQARGMKTAAGTFPDGPICREGGASVSRRAYVSQGGPIHL